jgi:hypothetical protein
MVQVVPADPGWSEAFQGLGKGLVGGYQNRSDEMALQKSISALGENPTPQAVLKAVTSTKTYNPEAKANFFKQFLGAAKLEETSSKAALQREKDAAKAAHDIAAEKRANEQLELNKRAQELNENKFKYTQEHPKPEKAPPKSEFEKVRERKAAEEYSKLEEHVPILKDNLKGIEDVRALAKSRGFFGPVAGALGLGKSHELNAKSFPLIQQIVKAFNPSGPIAQRKLEFIKDQYEVKATDMPWKVEGKLNALEYWTKQALAREEQKLKLYQKYDGIPPKDELEQFERESDSLSDAMMDYQIDPLAPVSGYVSAKTGEELNPIPRKEAEELEAKGLIKRGNAR